jgi:hypothetical protein
MLPQVGVSGGTPAPRNDSDASAMIASATMNVHCTISGESVFGKICRNMMPKSRTPIERAAST